MSDLSGLPVAVFDGVEPLPPYTDPRSALKQALPALRPAEQLSVTESAERYMRVNISGQWQPFRREVAPYMVEPTDMIASRRFRGLVFAGPSQSGKSMMLQTAICYTSEFKDPKTDTFKAIFYSGLLCCVFFFLVPFSFQGVLGHAGMLAPGLATMLVVITTDAVVDPEVADLAPIPAPEAN